jgi:hypothetical protein
VAAEYAELESIAGIVEHHAGSLSFKVAKPLGAGIYCHQLITVEAGAPGEHMQLTMFPMSQDERLAFLRKHLPTLMESACAISRFAPERERHVSAASWLRAVETAVEPSFIERGRAIGDRYREWMGHGDFTLENCILDQETNEITVVDWEFVRDGVPPLYDLFTLYFAILYNIEPPAEVAAKISERSLAQFYTLFFHENELSQLIASTTRAACARLGIDPSGLWQLFEDSVLFRTGYLIERGSHLGASRVEFLHAMRDWKADFQL